MPTNTPAPPEIFISFLKEMIVRLFEKTPVFFKIISWISFAAFLATGLPGIIEYFGVSLPENLQILQNEIVGWASAIVTYVTRLTVIDPSNLPLSGNKQQ